MSTALPPRLRRLPHRAPIAGIEVRVAADPLARLLGLAGLEAIPSNLGLLLPRTRSVHTFGMRFPLDLLWLDRHGRVIRVNRGVPPGCFRACRRARDVLEITAWIRRPW